MIPLKLTLKNFLSYGDQLQTIDFERYSLICLSGKNGNGKTAMLDAMTWALWGQARKISGAGKADEGLLRLGQTRMMVSFDFSFNDRHYRVRREFAKTHGKPHTALDFEVYDDIGERFVSLTDKTIRGTQEKIESLMGLDFDTFVNSSFLRQGQSNEFSKKSPKERKQILTSILGLGQYDQLQQCALEHARGLADEKRIIATLHEQAVQECAGQAELLAQQEQAGKDVAQLEQEHATGTTALRLLEQQKVEQARLTQQVVSMRNEQLAVQRTIDQTLVAFHEQAQAWKKVHYSMLDLPNLEKLEQDRMGLRGQEEQWRTVQQQALMVQEKLLITKEAVQKKSHELKNSYEQALYGTRLTVEKQRMSVAQASLQIKQTELQIAQFEQSLQRILAEQQAVNAQLRDREQQLAAFTTEQLQFDKRRAFYQVMVQKGNWLKAELTEAAQKKEVLAEQDEASCPLCEQVLTVKRKQFLAAKMVKHESFANSRLNRVAQVIKKLKALLLDQHAVVQENSKKQELLQQAVLRSAELTKQHAQVLHDLKSVHEQHSTACSQEQALSKSIKESEQVLAAQEAELATLLEQHPQLKPLLDAIQQLEAERLQLSYDQPKHQAVCKELAQVEEKIRYAQSVVAQYAEQQVRKNRIYERGCEVKALRIRFTEIHQQRELIEQQLQQFTQLDEQMHAAQQHLHELQQRKELLGKMSAQLAQSLQRIERILKEQETRKFKAAEVDREADEYQALATAFGKNGIQALLIEEAIPEIEQEANNLLAKLTDNQAQIFIESLRDLKKGGMKETLDIQISDSAGVRPYEMFSGGEAFRIDFALRIAISKLLARRAGTALQTLIIDEGFGSQDEDALGRLMDALYAVQHDFAKVIIVSHLQAMKDNFPVHFIVEKRPEGSVVRVEERG